jgi:uncharacterized RDD family membrane protein YckC
MDFTYKIVGGDGREYGPVSLDDLHEWIHAGRVDVATPVLRSDLAAWKPADDYLELRFDLNQASKAARAEETEPTSDVQETVVIENAGFFPRFCAYVMDWFTLYTIGMILNSVLGLTAPEKITPEFFTSSVFWKSVVLNMAVSFAYTVYFVGSSGATPGKFMMGLRVVSAADERIGYGRAMIRWGGEYVSRLTFGIGHLMVLWQPERRALHDLIAGTKVISLR